MKWRELKRDKQLLNFVLIPSVLMLIIAVIMRINNESTGVATNTGTQIMGILQLNWFYIGVLVPSLQFLYLKSRFKTSVWIFILVSVISMLIIGVPDYNYGIFTLIATVIFWLIGYLIGMITMVSVVKPELKYHKITQIQGRDLAILLIPLLINWLFFNSVMPVISTHVGRSIPIWLIINSVILIALYACVSGYFGHLPISTMVITTLSLAMVAVFVVVSYSGIIIVVGSLLIEFIVIFSGVYIWKRQIKNKVS